MLISLNEIKKLVPEAGKVSTDELVRLIGSRLVEVEGTYNFGEKYSGVTIVKVESAEAIPETHLHLCQVDAGEEELVQVVCGAPNVHAGMLAVWIRPGAIVPATYGEEDFRLDVRKLRGYESHGMLAGADELGLDEEHKFIAEIDPLQEILDGSRRVEPGDAFSTVFDVDDVILDIENKSLTHRPDTFGLIGFSREVAGILGVKFEEPSVDFAVAGVRDRVPLEIEVSDKELCPRYTAAVFEVKDALLAEKYLKPSAVFLAKAGMRSISKIVDATNIVMLLMGQPLHAFDYDKFVAVGGGVKPKVLVRAAKEGEKLVLLDGKEIELNGNDIVITSSGVPVALAGAMGGASTAIDGSTHRVLLESATFSLYNLRKTQMAHGIFSEAITRFTKGQPVAGTLPALSRCASMLLGSPDEIISFEDCFTGKISPEVISVTVDEINALLGTEYNMMQISACLTNVGFDVVTVDKVEMKVTAPEWRTDIHIREDVIEEVGRLMGYDNIPATLPMRPFVGAEKNAMFELKREIREKMSGYLGAHEVLTYSFVSKALQEKCGEDTGDSYEIVNSISPELQVFRQSLTPSLLEKLQMNERAGYENFRLYEMNQVARKSAGLEDGVPKVENRLAVVLTGDYYEVKSVFEKLMGLLGVSYEMHEFSGRENAAYFETKRSVEVWSGDRKLGALGEIRRRVAGNLKIKGVAAAMEISLDELVKCARTRKAERKFSKYPSTTRDVTFEKVSGTYGELFGRVCEVLDGVPDLIYKVKPVSIYAPERKAERNISFRIVLQSEKKTLEAAEISAIMEEVEKIK